MSVKDLNEVVVKGSKSYDRHYIWGQLVGWYKQTVDKPNASLSAERRGSLSYPDLESFFNVFECNKEVDFEKNFKYCFGNRDNFFDKLIESPGQMWPVGNEWSFRNKNK